MATTSSLPTAREIRAVAAMVDELALRSALDEDGATLGATLAQVAGTRELYRALALSYLRVAGNDWASLTGERAFEVARRACVLADDL